MELAEDGEKCWGTAKLRQDFSQAIAADSVKGLGQVHMFYLLHFSLICLSTMIMSAVLLLDLNAHWLSDVFSCTIVRISVFSRTRAKILPAVENWVMPR